MWHSYVFEAKGIQPYILAGGKLRHIVGGSAIIHDLCRRDPGSLLDRTLRLCGLVDSVLFLRAAGGSFTFGARGEGSAAGLAEFAALWPLAVQMHAPGLAFADASASGASLHACLAEARGQMGGRRGFSGHRLPAAAPPVWRTQRTGLAVVDLSRLGGDDQEPLDAGLHAKELVREDKRGRDVLGARFISPVDGVTWPQNMETEFPFLTEDRTVAILHADGNRMGELVQALGEALKDQAGEAYAETFHSFSDTVDLAMQKAVEIASSCIKDAVAAGPDGRLHYPARPIVCAGDDLTIVLRADIALAFTESFLEAFEAECAARLPPVFAKAGGLGLRGADGVAHEVPKLTACAGLVFAQANQPFLQVSELAESACKHAKKGAKALAPERWQTVPSAVTIHRLAGALIEDYETVITAELTVADRGILTANPYRVGSLGEAGRLPKLSDLKALAETFRKSPVGGGVWREIATLLYMPQAEATVKLRRIEERARKKPEMATALRDFQRRYRALFPEASEPGEEFSLFFDRRSPFTDAVILSEMQRRAGHG